MYTAGDLHFAIWDFVAEELKKMEESGGIKKEYKELYNIKEDAVKQLDISDNEREYLEKNANCVLCACEMACYQCPLYKAYNVPCSRSYSPYAVIGYCITKAQSSDKYSKELNKQLLTEAYEEACKIRDVTLPATYAEPLCVP